MSEQERLARAKATELRQNCNRLVTGHDSLSFADELEELARFTREHNIDRDHYGAGTFLNSFEEEMAQELGYEAAVFMPSGTMAQQIALRIWCDQAPVAQPKVGFHATSHLEANEHRAYSHLHGLQAILLGESQSPLSLKDFETCAEPLTAALIELPQRHLGGVLPEWEELESIKRLAEKNGTRLHLDGARLWEAQPYYGKRTKEICDGFDSAYISFYKGLGSLTGAMLLGPQTLIDQARIWQRRHGGNLYQLTPFAASSKLGWLKRKNRFEGYWRTAQKWAAALAQTPEVTIHPDPPQTALFHVHVRGDATELNQKRDELAEKESVWLGGFRPTAVPKNALLEISVGDSASSITAEELKSWVEFTLQK